MPKITPFPVKKLIPKLGMAALFLVAACSSDPNNLTAAKAPSGQPPSVTRGVTRALPEIPRRPLEKSGYDTVGIASWYGGRYHGRQTASGEIYDKNAPTAAHRTLPFGSRVHVTNLANGRSVTVRINDRGPFVPRRIIDVSQHAAEVLGFIRQGVTQVRVRTVQRGG
jgi:rare lipoprotein A